MCDKTWKRDKSRGRKPTACPKCAKAVAANKEDEKKQVAKRAVKAQPVEIANDKIETTVHTKSEVSIYDVYRGIYPKPANYQEFLESTRNGSEWFCKSCKKSLRSEIPLSVPPTHRCPEKSTNIKEYERVA
jgi:hypothetical protein